MKRLLLINDSKFESMIMKDLLSDMGYYVKIVGEHEAVEQVQSFCPNYIVVNYIMKDILGDQLISVIKLHNKDIKCFLSSNNPISSEVLRNKKIDGVFQTPIDKDGLEEVFRKVNGVNVSSKEEVKNDQKEKGKPWSCTNCGNRFDEGQQIKILFCPFCGHKI